MYDIRNGQPIWCKVENVIHNFGHHAVEIDDNRIFIMDVHQTVLITEVRFQIETRSLIGWYLGIATYKTPSVTRVMRVNLKTFLSCIKEIALKIFFVEYALRRKFQ